MLLAFNPSRLPRPSFSIPISNEASFGRRTESSDLLSVLDQLNPDTLSDSGVGLLGLNTDLLEDDTLGVGRSTEWRGLVGGSEKTLLEGQIGPTLLATMVAELAGGVETSWLSCGYCELLWCDDILVVMRGGRDNCDYRVFVRWRGVCVPLPMIAVVS
jgi:hypothetical protein